MGLGGDVLDPWKHIGKCVILRCKLFEVPSCTEFAECFPNVSVSLI